MINYIECCPRSISIKLKISVTNNFGFNVHNDSHGDTLLSFIENKHRAILHEELKISRNQIYKIIDFILDYILLMPMLKGE